MRDVVSKRRMLFLNELLCNGLPMRITTFALPILAKRVFEADQACTEWRIRWKDLS